MSELVSNNQREFVLGALRGGLRVDGRTIHSMRQPVAHFGARTGQCEVAMGYTRALAVATCAVVEPLAHRANDGFLTFTTYLSPMADFAFSQLRSNSEEASAVSRIIERTLKGSRAIDTEALCILSGKSVWSLRVEVTVLDNDGNIIDCCLLACILALLHLRRPAITIDGDRVIVHSSEAREPVPLSIHHVPVCISYALYDSGKMLVCDPTLEEEKCSSGRVIIGMNMHSEICLLDYPGGLPISSRVFRQLPKAAFDKVKAITEFIDKSLQEDKERRRMDVMPVYARKFYEARRQRDLAQAAATATAAVDGPNATPDTEAEALKENGALAGDDPFAGFLGRLVRQRALVKATSETEEGANNGPEGDEEMEEEGEEEEDEETHVHDANVAMEDGPVGADEGEMREQQEEEPELEADDEGTLAQTETQPANTGDAETTDVPQPKRTIKKRRVASTTANAMAEDDVTA